MLKKIIEECITESSLSRVQEHWKNHQTGTISAFRYARNCGKGKPFTLQENRKRNALLKAELLKRGYGITKIYGTCVENYGTDKAKEVNEESFFVVDLKDKKQLKKDLVELGKMFEQDSITFAEPGEEYYLISTNNCPDAYPGFGKIGEEVKLGKPEFGKANKDTEEFFRKIRGRGFVFKNIGENLMTFDKLSYTEKLSIKKILRS